MPPLSLQIDGRDHVVCLREYLDISGLQQGDHMLYVDDAEKAGEIVRNLTSVFESKKLGVSVSLKQVRYTGCAVCAGTVMMSRVCQDFPVKYAYRDSRRVGTIIFTPKPGWALSFDCTAAILANQSRAANASYHSATHGMIPEDWRMRGILAMRGPAFHSQRVVSEEASWGTLGVCKCRRL